MTSVQGVDRNKRNRVCSAPRKRNSSKNPFWKALLITLPTNVRKLSDPAAAGRMRITPPAAAQSRLTCHTRWPRPRPSSRGFAPKTSRSINGMTKYCTGLATAFPGPPNHSTGKTTSPRLRSRAIIPDHNGTLSPPTHVISMIAVRTPNCAHRRPREGGAISGSGGIGRVNRTVSQARREMNSVLASINPTSIHLPRKSR